MGTVAELTAEIRENPAAKEARAAVNGYPDVNAEVRFVPDAVCVVAFSGRLDKVAAPTVAQVLAEYVPPGERLVVDLTRCTVVAAAGAAVLRDAARTTASTVIVAIGAAATAVKLIAPGPGADLAGSTGEALRLLGLPPDFALPAPAVIDVRRMHTRAHIARSLRAVRRRYGVPEPVAFGLMREASQRFNVRLRLLAGAVLDLREPCGPEWFPGRRRIPRPRASFRSRTTPATTLCEALDRVLSLSGSDRGSTQTADPFHIGLWLEGHRGFDDAFAGTFAMVTGGTTCSLALRHRRQVVSTDLETDPHLAGTDQSGLLRAGVRAVQSTPVLGPGGSGLGVLSTHYRDPGALPGDADLRRIATVAEEAGEWLDWYRRVVVFDALEHLHQRGRDVLLG
ncbi:GAF and ANTAR domain-containing protein [Amycolatopsis solani]|uniref:GAF and ANTAR domain-containing protein n=1 Tax=Amycolatopsis solani TaxID=3028615 RepID=UPI00296FB62F|nr:GAF and ANTAR domain-containing protein [Amycolatopsis sp. MEP2-6]